MPCPGDDDCTNGDTWDLLAAVSKPDLVLERTGNQISSEPYGIVTSDVIQEGEEAANVCCDPWAGWDIFLDEVDGVWLLLDIGVCGVDRKDRFTARDSLRWLLRCAILELDSQDFGEGLSHL